MSVSFFRRFCLISSLILFPLKLWPKEILTWGKCVELVRAGNAEIHASENNFSAAQFSTIAAKSGYFPQISGSLCYLQSGSIINSTGSNASFSTSVTATENIFNGFQDRAKHEQALASERVAQAALKLTQAKVSFELKSALEKSKI